MGIVQFHSLFCDDIRREADGRASLMGVFPGRIYLPDDEQHLIPKVCAQANVVIPANMELQRAYVTVELNGKEIKRMEMPNSLLTQIMEQQPGHGVDESEEGVAVLAFMIEMREVRLSAGDKLQAIAHVNDEKTEGLPVQIRRKARKSDS